eukprot:529812-Pleurochrysis_carterae.AAC.1
MPSLLKVLTCWARLLVNQAGVEAVANWSKRVFVLVGVGNDEVVNPSNNEEKQAFALEGEDAWFAPALHEFIAF